MSSTAIQNAWPDENMVQAPALLPFAWHHDPTSSTAIQNTWLDENMVQAPALLPFTWCHNPMSSTAIQNAWPDENMVGCCLWIKSVFSSSSPASSSSTPTPTPARWTTTTELQSLSLRENRAEKTSQALTTGMKIKYKQHLFTTWLVLFVKNWRLKVAETQPWVLLFGAQQSASVAPSKKKASMCGKSMKHDDEVMLNVLRCQLTY